MATVSTDNSFSLRVLGNLVVRTKVQQVGMLSGSSPAPADKPPFQFVGPKMDCANPISLWEKTSNEAEIRSDCVPGGHVDVAIVGGGYTGLSTALHCAERGLSAHLLEGQRIGYGGSGRNVGLVNASVWLSPAKVREKLGPQHGPRFLARFSRAPATVFELIEKHQIRCEATRAGTIHAAHAPSGMRDLRERYQEWQSMGQPVELLTREEAAEMIGTRAFHGGLLDHRAGTINPMGYCRGLARAASAAGAIISTGALVRKLIREGDVWRIESSRGELTADNVVLGTNAYSDDLWPRLRKVFTIIHYFQLATRPLGPAAAGILPGYQGLWDTGPVMFSLRRDSAGRLLIGSMGRVIGSSERGLTRRWAIRQIRRLFPDLRAVEFEDAWHGQIAMTPDHLPRIHQPAAGIWTAIGYNGRGITTGTLFGQAMADLIGGMDPAELPLPITEASVAPRAALNARMLDIAFTANQAWKSIG